MNVMTVHYSVREHWVKVVMAGLGLGVGIQTSFYRTVVLKLDHASESPGGLLNPHITGPQLPEVLIQQVWDRV